MNSRKFLVTGATGATGREITRLLVEKGHKVRVLVHKKDERSEALAKLGVEIAVGDLLNFNEVTEALSGIDGAYFVYPIQPGLIQATTYFAEAAKEAGVKTIVNMSQISSRRDSESHAAQDHWLAERVFDWSGLNVTHVRPTFFAEWLLYVAPVVGSGVMRMPLSPEARHAPVAAEDQAKVIANILDEPEVHAGKIYPLFGAKELNQNEIAEAVGRTLGRTIKYEQVPVSVFINDIIGSGVSRRSDVHKDAEGKQTADANQFLLQHLEAVSLDHKNGLFAGNNDVMQTIGKTEPLDVEQYVRKNIQAFQPKAEAATV